MVDSRSCVYVCMRRLVAFDASSPKKQHGLDDTFTAGAYCILKC